MPSKRKLQRLSNKKAAKDSAMKKSGHSSKYARKAAYLKTHGGSGLDYPDKPWR